MSKIGTESYITQSTKEFGYKSVRTPFTMQREGESFTAWQNRLDARRSANTKRMQAKREAAKREVALNAYRRVEESKNLAFEVATRKVDPTDKVSTPEQIRTTNEWSALSVSEALGVERSKKRLLKFGTKCGDKFADWILQDIRSKSHTLGKVRRPRWDDFEGTNGGRLVRNMSIFKSMRESSPWKVAKAVPVPGILPVRIPHVNGKLAEVPDFKEVVSVYDVDIDGVVTNQHVALSVSREVYEVEEIIRLQELSRAVKASRVRPESSMTPVETPSQTPQLRFRDGYYSTLDVYSRYSK